MDPLKDHKAVVDHGIAFRTLEGQSFLRLPLFTGGCYGYGIRSLDFRNWFFSEFHNRYDHLPTEPEFRAIMTYLESQASSEPLRKRHLFRRVGSRSDLTSCRTNQIFLDLANEEGRYIHITADGWKVVAADKADFLIGRASNDIPEPKGPGALDKLRPLINPATDADWLRAQAWLLAALRVDRPIPILTIQGQPGSGKTMAMRLLHALIDPSAAPVLQTPSRIHELLNLARNAWVLPFDEVRKLSPAMASAFSRLSCGMGVTTREAGLPTSEPLLQFLRRPIMLAVTRKWKCPEALVEKSLTFNLAPLAHNQRRTETSLVAEFSAAWPEILAGLATAASTAIRRLPETENVRGRCADALSWALAAAPDLGCTEDEMYRAFHTEPERTNSLQVSDNTPSPESYRESVQPPSTPKTFGTAIVAAAIILITCLAAFAQQRTIDTAKSTMTVRVDKAGVFSAFGHDHQIAAPVAVGFVDAKSHEVELRVKAATMTVRDPGVSDKDRAEIQKNMVGAEVLDADRYPEIVFHSTSAEQASPGTWKVRGNLTLHGQTQPVELEVRESAGRYTGAARIKQSAFGIKPIKVAGGTVRVKDEIRIEFEIHLTP